MTVAHRWWRRYHICYAAQLGLRIAPLQTWATASITRVQFAKSNRRYSWLSLLLVMPQDQGLTLLITKV